jgi:hypothetical protein
MPLDDDDILEAAKPVPGDEKIKFDPKKVADRDAEMVRRLLKREGWLS